MALTDKLTAIGNAIRKKTGNTNKLTLEQMVSEISSIPVGINGIESWCQQNDTVTAYLSDADKKYTDDNYSTTSVILDYASADKTNDDPVGKEITANGTIDVTYIGDGKPWSESAKGNYTLYNIIPYHTAEIDGSFYYPTGFLRQIYIDGSDNVRDLGGWKCDGGRVKYGILYRGYDGTDNSALINTMNRVAQIECEIDLQDTTVTSSFFGNSVEYFKFPLSTYYLDSIDLSGSEYSIVAQALTKLMQCGIDEKPTYIHCSIGRDRTGILCFLALSILGVSSSDCDKDYEMTALTGKLFGGNITNCKRSRLATTHQYFESMGETLRDGVLRWCYECGIDIDLINAYRKAMSTGYSDELSYEDFKTVTNWLLQGIDESGNTYVVRRAYMSSGGVVSEDSSDARHVSGFIPVKQGDIVRFKNILWNNATVTDYGGKTISSGNQRVAFYDSSKAFLGIITGNGIRSNNTYLDGVVFNSANNSVTQFTVKGTGTVAYIRIALGFSSEDAILTVNEEIEQ